MQRPPWTDTRKTEAAKLWNDGFSSRQIAMQFCVSRNSVIGIAHRNPDLFLPKTAGNQNRPSRASNEPKRVYKRVIKSPPVALPKFEVPTEAPISKQLTLVERGLFECVFPTHSEGTSHLFCGHATTKAEWYCAHTMHVSGSAAAQSRKGRQHDHSTRSTPLVHYPH